jgi:hypothetical protein
MIYHLFPVRSYPNYLPALTNGTKFSFEYHDPVVCEKDTENVMLYGNDPLPTHADQRVQIGDSTPEDNGIGKGSREIDFLFGPFPYSKMEEDSRKRLTIVQEPVDHVYEMWAYLHGLQHQDREPRKDSFIHIFKEYVDMSMEDFIDKFLIDDGVVSAKGYTMIPELFRLLHLHNGYDYVGAVEHLPKSFQGISKVLGRDVQCNITPFPISPTYKRKQLSMLLEEDLAIYGWVLENL